MWYHYGIGPNRPSLSGCSGPNSIMVLYMEPLGFVVFYESE